MYLKVFPLRDHQQYLRLASSWNSVSLPTHWPMHEAHAALPVLTSCLLTQGAPALALSSVHHVQHAPSAQNTSALLFPLLRFTQCEAASCFPS